MKAQPSGRFTPASLSVVLALCLTATSTASGAPATPPDNLPVKSWNVAEGDYVAPGKAVGLKLDPAFPLPQTPLQRLAWDKQFPAQWYLLSTGGEEYPVPLSTQWLEAPYDPSGPVLKIRPRSVMLAPGRSYRVVVQTGEGQQQSRTFRVLQDVKQFKQVTITLPPDPCDECWPHPVKVIITLPPGYADEDPGYDNREPGGENLAQTYPVIIALHWLEADATDALWVVDALRYGMERGTAQPMIVVAPTGTLSAEICALEPVLSEHHCDPIFLGNFVPGDKFNSFTTFLADTMREYLRGQFRVAGTENGQVSDANAYRRGHGIVGTSGGSTGVALNAHFRPDAYGAAYVLAGGGLSVFNPYAYAPVVDDNEEGAYLSVCPEPGAPGQREPYQDGYRELYSLPDGLHYRQVHWDERRGPD